MSRLSTRVEKLEQSAPELPIKVIWQSRDGKPGFYHNSTGAGTILGDDEIEMLALTHTLIKVCYSDKAEQKTGDIEDENNNS